MNYFGRKRIFGSGFWRQKGWGARAGGGSASARSQQWGRGSEPVQQSPPPSALFCRPQCRFNLTLPNINTANLITCPLQSRSDIYTNSCQRLRLNALTRTRTVFYTPLGNIFTLINVVTVTIKLKTFPHQETFFLLPLLFVGNSLRPQLHN